MYSPDKVIEGVFLGVIEHNLKAPTYFQPQLVLNDSNRDRKILEFILGPLELYTQYLCSVAFKTRVGIYLLNFM